MRNSHNITITESDTFAADDETTVTTGAVVGFIAWLLALGFPCLMYGPNTLFFFIYTALFPRIAARGDCRGYCLALAIEGEVAAEHYLYPAGGWGDVWRTIFMVIGLGKRLLTIADVVHSLVIIQTVTNNEIMFSLHTGYT